MTTLLLGAVHSALADTSGATACDVHAAAMVAEMRASATTPMSEQEIALVRETARKSCIAQHGGTPTPAGMATPAPAASASVAPAPAAKAKSDNSFFGTLGAIFSGPTDRKPGNQRLLERSQH
ncbi:MAG: hypothetical protein IT492_08820 [Gammaproteobacteria bacterium]|nr:hypothetical protein [Gammaproteobacteria bacterium]